MKTKLLLLSVISMLALSVNFYDSAKANVIYNSIGIIENSWARDQQFVNKALLVLQAGDEDIVDIFLADPEFFLREIEREVSFNQLYSEWKFYRKIEVSAYYRSNLGQY